MAGTEIARAGDLKGFSVYLEKRRGALQTVAANHMDPARLMKIVLACVARTPALKACTMESVFRCSMQAAELGLDPGGALGEAYLVPFKDVCQLIVGYRGLITLARRSGEVHAVYAHNVYEGDEFRMQLGTDPIIRHVPAFGTSDPSKITHAYAVARLKGSDVPVFDQMTKAQVDLIRARSRAGSSGPWTTDYGEMARKTVVRRLCKYLPMSAEMAKALALDNAVDSGDAIPVEFEAFDVDPDTGEVTEPRAPASTRGVNAVREAVQEAQPTLVDPMQ